MKVGQRSDTHSIMLVGFELSGVYWSWVYGFRDFLEGQYISGVLDFQAVTG